MYMCLINTKKIFDIMNDFVLHQKWKKSGFFCIYIYRMYLVERGALSEIQSRKRILFSICLKSIGYILYPVNSCSSRGMYKIRLQKCGVRNAHKSPFLSSVSPKKLLTGSFFSAEYIILIHSSTSLLAIFSSISLNFLYPFSSSSIFWYSFIVAVACGEHITLSLKVSSTNVVHCTVCSSIKATY